MKFDSDQYSSPIPLEEYPTLLKTDSGSGAPLAGILSSSELVAGSALAWTTRPGWRIPPRRRNDSYLWIIQEGRGRMEIQGTDNQVAVGPGTAVIVPENRLHRLDPDQKAPRFRVLVFHFLFRYLGALDVFTLLNLQGPLQLLHPRTQETSMELCEAYALQRPGWRSYLAAGLLYLLYPALLAAAEGLNRTEYPFASPLFRRLAPAFAYIDRNMTDPNLSIQKVADAAGVSQVYLRRLFNQYIGKTPQRFILEKRLHAARDLLLHTDLTVETVAESAGFETPSYFYRTFRKVYGASPGVFRRRPQV